MKTKSSSCYTVLILLLLLTSCGPRNSGNSIGRRMFFFIKSPNTGSYFSAGSAWARLITANTHFIGVNSTSTATENDKIKMLDENMAQAAFLKGPEASFAYHGDPVYWKNPQKISALFALWPAAYDLIAQNNSGIRTIEDIRGKSIAIYSDRSVNGDILYYLLSLYGINTSNTTIYRVRESIGVMMFIRKEVDSIWYNLGYEESFIQQQLFSGAADPLPDSGYLINIPVYPDNILKEFFKTYPYFYLENSKLVTSSFVACSSSVSESDAYLLTKLWWENEDFIKQYVPDNLKLINRKDNRHGIPIPFHNGSLRYLREAGLIPALPQ